MEPSRTRRRIGVVSLLGALSVFATPSVASAALAISVPATANLGAAASGAGSHSATLGTVTVTASGLVAPSFTASVASSNFTTGSGTSPETISKASLAYWSGPLTASTGLQTAAPGQLTVLQAQTLSSSRIAFGSTGIALSISTSWKPTIVITLPAGVVAGTYTGTITHSVA